jgi:hypothetical protein
LALLSGTRLGAYEVTAQIGALGMGEVYKARDTRLDRTVAVKVLPADLAADPDRRARFEREARAIAALSHPHICTIHDVGRHEEIDYLVMEYLDGETLADRLAHGKGPLPLEQVLKIGIDIADALDNAHRADIGDDCVLCQERGGGGKEEPVLSQTAARASGVESVMVLWDWSPDGRYLLFSATTSSDYDLWLLPLAGDPKPVSFLSAARDQVHGNLSPDGRLVAYSSNESGRFEVHVQTFPLTDRQWTVSTTGGYEPRWRADGREMYYLSLDQKLMASALVRVRRLARRRNCFRCVSPEA